VDVDKANAKDADAAIAFAWKLYKPEAKWPLKVATDRPDKDGWARQKDLRLSTSPNEKRDVGAITKFRWRSMDGRPLWTCRNPSRRSGVRKPSSYSIDCSRKAYARESFAGKNGSWPWMNRESRS